MPSKDKYTYKGGKSNKGNTKFETYSHDYDKHTQNIKGYPGYYEDEIKRKIYYVEIGDKYYNPFAGIKRSMPTKMNLTYYTEGEIPIYISNKVYDAVSLGSALTKVAKEIWGEKHEYTNRMSKFRNALYDWMYCHKLAIVSASMARDNDTSSELHLTIGYGNALADGVSHLFYAICRLSYYMGDANAVGGVDPTFMGYLTENYPISILFDSLIVKMEAYIKDCKITLLTTDYGKM